MRRAEIRARRLPTDITHRVGDPMDRFRQLIEREFPPRIPAPVPEFGEDSSDVEDPAVPYYDPATGTYR